MSQNKTDNGDKQKEGTAERHASDVAQETMRLLWECEDQGWVPCTLMKSHAHVTACLYPSSREAETGHWSEAGHLD